MTSKLPEIFSMKKIQSIFIKSLLCFVFLLFLASSAAYAQDASSSSTLTPTPDNSAQQLKDLTDKIADLEKKVSTLQSQGKTLSSEIAVMDGQINLTNLRINATKQEIKEFESDIKVATAKVESLEGTLDKITKVLLNRIRTSYQEGKLQGFEVVLASHSVTDYVAKANYLKLVKEHDRRLLYDTQQAKNDYQNQKSMFEDKKKKVEQLNTQLVSYTAKLDQDKTAKQSLLALTKNDEEKYQKLLRDARAQTSAFKSFATSQSGSSILPAQSSPDGWYYNQRDERWGRQLIGGSSEQVWEVGCLISSVAMVLKQKGENVTPADIAGNSSNFFSNTAYMLIPWVGGRFQSVWTADIGAIDSKLSSGQPVIVGLRAGPLGQHFIVLKSGSSGSYIMNDPWNGYDLKFSDYYSTGQIFQYGYLK